LYKSIENAVVNDVSGVCISVNESDVMSGESEAVEIGGGSACFPEEERCRGCFECHLLFFY
jgi:hypothetical protein